MRVGYFGRQKLSLLETLRPNKGYIIRPYREGKFVVHLTNGTVHKPVLVSDIHPGHGAKILAAMALSKKDAQKLCRVFNLLGTKGIIFDWKFMNRVKEKFEIEYTYAEDVYYHETL